ncbi:MAG: DUF2157 domain-containing protein [Gammaproteobacteria bacterium]
MNKQEAQLRADQIRAYQSEAMALQGAGILSSNAALQADIQQYHSSLLQQFAAEFDIDTSHDQKRLSWGMRLASFFGALALSAAVFFFFYRFWGGFSTFLQVGLLIAAPLLMTLAIDFAARRERSLYFASLISLVALACFVLNLSVLGQIFNITPSPNAFLVWAAFAFLLAYGYGLKLVLVAGLTCLMAWLSAEVGSWSGMYWLSFGERPENFILGGLVVFALGLREQRAFPGFAGIFRVYGLLVVFIAILIMANWGRNSYLPFSTEAIENAYQLAGFVLSSIVVWLGIRRHWPGLVNLGSTFFVLYLYTKLFDWFWDWMPKYVFFLIVGLMAILLLFVLQRLRGCSQEELT